MRTPFSRLPTQPAKTTEAPRSPVDRPSSKKWWMYAGGGIGLVALFFWWSSAGILGEAVEIDQAVDDPVFAHSMGSLLGAWVTGGNRADTLVNGAEFIPVMVDAIRSAKRSVTLESYIWASGAVSDLFIEALADRARNGVKVHVLGDGMGMLKFADDDQRRLLDAGVEFHAYGREHWYEIKPNINHRTHRKLLIIDGLVGFTGGMCIDDQWQGNADAIDLWRDTQIRVEGPVVLQMQAVFATNWMQTTSRLLFGDDYFPTVTRAGDVPALCYMSGPNENPENARVSYLVAIAAAKKSIRIAHAYFIPDDLAIEMLLKARQRGVEIDVIVPAINDSRFGRAAARSRWGALLAAGVRFHLFEGAMYHVKAMVVDDHFVTIGSVNFDNRSFGLNDEVNVNIFDRGVALRHVEIFADDLARSRPLTLAEFRDRGWVIKGLDHFCGLFRSQL